MYDIKALVGRRSDLDIIAALDSRFCVVDLALKPFALLPLDDAAFPALRDLWHLLPPDADPIDMIELPDLQELATHLAATLPRGAVALVEAEFFGGAGQGIGLAIRSGEIAVFDEPDDPWPDTNISRALKWIGVPERLDDHQDAFDVLGLGRFRRVAQWRASLTPS